MKNNAWFKLAVVSLGGVILIFGLLIGIQSFNQNSYNSYNMYQQRYNTQMQGTMNAQGNMGMMNGRNNMQGNMGMMGGMKEHGNMGMMDDDMNMNMQGGMGMMNGMM